MPETIDSLIIILAVIAPGFLMREAISLYRPREERTEFETILDSIILGFFNSSIFIILVILFWKLKIVLLPCIDINSSFFVNLKYIIYNYPFKFIIFSITYLFAMPIIIGWGFGKWIGFIRRLNPFPSAWDEFFINTPRVTLYLILKNGNKICGTFGKKSRASTNPKYRDLYLENEILLDKGGKPIGLIKNSGLWINRDEISYFKILPYYYEEKEIE